MATWCVQPSPSVLAIIVVTTTTTATPTAVKHAPAQLPPHPPPHLHQSTEHIHLLGAAPWLVPLSFITPTCVPTAAFQRSCSTGRHYSRLLRPTWPSTTTFIIPLIFICCVKLSACPTVAFNHQSRLPSIAPCRTIAGAAGQVHLPTLCLSA